MSTARLERKDGKKEKLDKDRATGQKTQKRKVLGRNLNVQVGADFSLVLPLTYRCFTPVAKINYSEPKPQPTIHPKNADFAHPGDRFLASRVMTWQDQPLPTVNNKDSFTYPWLLVNIDQGHPRACV